MKNTKRRGWLRIILIIACVILLVGIIGAVALAQRARKKTLSLLYDRPDQRADEETEA